MSEKIPDTDSIEELARFWDTHDLTDFEDQLEEVGEPVFERGEALRLQLPLSAQERAELRRIALSKGLQEADMIREWVREKIKAS